MKILQPIAGILFAITSVVPGGFVQSIPVIGDVVTVLESTGKAIEAGILKAARDRELADQHLQASRNSWKAYAEDTAIATNINIAVAAADNDFVKVALLLKNENAWNNFLEGTPEVGGCVQYPIGNRNLGGRCIMSELRSKAIIRASTVRFGDLDCGAAGVTDGVKGKSPVIDAIEPVLFVIDTGDPEVAFNAAVLHSRDFAGDSMRGILKELEKSLPAGSIAEQAKANAENPDSRPHVYETTSNNRVIAHFMNEFQNQVDLLKGLGKDLSKRSYRVFQQGNVSIIRTELGSNLLVGHTSIILKGTQVISACELIMDQDGDLMLIKYQSSYYQLPFKLLRHQIGIGMPKYVLTFSSPVFGDMFENLYQASSGIYRMLDIQDFGVKLFLARGQNPSFDRNYYSVSFYLNGHVEIITCGTLRIAEKTYESIPVQYDKILYHPWQKRVLKKHGNEEFVKQCDTESFFFFQSAQSSMDMEDMELMVNEIFLYN